MYSVFALVVITAIAQQTEPTVSKDSLSVHRVERGAMPLRELADGSISSIAPPRATVIVSAQQRATLRIGQTGAILIAAPGAKIDALIDVGVAKNVLFFGRPADARPQSTSSVFVLEPDGEHARRVVVEYGRRSGSLIEIVKGLSEGDRVIVTDMSQWTGHDRVRLK